MSDEKNIRHRFTVPKEDTLVNEWIDNQSNLAFSLRLLISTCAKQMGTSDITCQLLGMDRPLPQKGRPRKDAKEKLLNFNPNSATVSGDDADYDDDVVTSEQPVQAQPKPVVKQVSNEVAKPVEKMEQPKAPVVQPDVNADDVLNFMGGTSSNTNTSNSGDNDSSNVPTDMFDSL